MYLKKKLISKLFWFSGYLIFAFTLIGCKKDNSNSDYLFENPAILEYIEAQQTDAEKFGQHILVAETTCAELQAALDKAVQSLASLKANNASPADIQLAETKKAQAEKAYLEKQQEVKMLLSVARLNGPE